MADNPPPAIPAPTDEELAAYVAELCADLAKISDGRPQLRTLRYLLGMAQLEAEKVRAPEEAGFR